MPAAFSQMTGDLRRWLALLALLCTGAQAKVECPLLFLEEGAPNLYYALVFVEPVDKQARERLMGQVAPQLNGIARKHNAMSKKPLRLKLITCEHDVEGNDFNLEEMKDFVTYKVVAVFWKGKEQNTPVLVQLAVPAYVRNESAERRDVEFVTPYRSQSENPIDRWIEVLGQDNALYRPFVSMGLATAYLNGGDYLTAWTALCESRNALAMLAPLRPPRPALNSEIVSPIQALMNEIEGAARKAGVASLPPCPVAQPTDAP